MLIGQMWVLCPHGTHVERKDASKENQGVPASQTGNGCKVGKPIAVHLKGLGYSLSLAQNKGRCGEQPPSSTTQAEDRNASGSSGSLLEGHKVVDQGQDSVLFELPRIYCYYLSIGDRNTLCHPNFLLDKDIK